MIAEAMDVVGNPGPGNSSVVTVTLVAVPSDYSGNLLDYNSNSNLPPPTPPVLAQSEAALFSRDASGKGLWFVQSTAPSNVPTWFTSGTALGTATDIPLQGDFDGDGKTDLATYNLNTALWTFNDSSHGSSSFVFGTSGISLPVVGNFDGPGVTEFGVFDIINNVGHWTIAMPTGGLRSVQFGLPGDIPVPGDYDGVDKDELAVYRPSTGQFVIYEGTGNPTRVISIPGVVPSGNLIPVPGEYDNQYYFQHGQTYKAEAAVFDLTTGTFTIAGPTGNETVAFKAGDIPVSADYAGTGSIQPAVFRPSTMQFLEKGTGGSDKVIATFPVPSSLTALPVSAPMAYRFATGSPTPTPTPTPTPPPTPTPTPTAPTLAFAPGSVVVVNGTTYAKTRQPSFVVTATPGATVDMILRGTKVIGSRVVGVFVASTAGSSAFRLLPGIKLGTYTMTAQANGLNSDVRSFKVVSRIPKSKPKSVHKTSTPARTVIRVQPNAVHAHQAQTASASNGHIIDQAVHVLVQNPLLFRNKKKGH